MSYAYLCTFIIYAKYQIDVNARRHAINTNNVNRLNQIAKVESHNLGIS